MVPQRKASAKCWLAAILAMFYSVSDLGLKRTKRRAVLSYRCARTGRQRSCTTATSQRSLYNVCVRAEAWDMKGSREKREKWRLFHHQMRKKQWAAIADAVN